LDRIGQILTGAVDVIAILLNECEPLVGSAANLFNIVNLGAPNGVLNSALFGKSQTLAGGQFALPTSGNRSFMLQLKFGF
jgi:hypothetical protein